MSAPAIIRAGRQIAERNMTSTVRIWRVTGRVLGEDGQYEDTTEEIYSGRGKVQFFDNAYEQTPEAGGHSYSLGRSTLHIPVGAADVAPGDLCTVTADPLNPHLLDRTWRITNTPAKSHQTADRMPIEEVLS